MRPAALQVDGYIRVSRVGYRGGERFISPSVQRDQIVGWAAGRGAHLLEIWEELDESGSRVSRPLLESAVQRIEAGVSQGLVVSKVDRFSRSLLDGLVTIQRIEAAGGAFFSVLDGLDLTTDTGRFILRVMLSMAESRGGVAPPVPCRSGRP
jgi:DNA invertase Pin-like site-specific DNA recombinase